MAEVHRILKEMYIGMAVCMIVFLAIGAFFMRPYYIFALALLVGNLGGALRIYHIYDVLDQALDMGEAGAKKKGDREQSATDDRDACFIGGFHFSWNTGVYRRGTWHDRTEDLRLSATTDAEMVDSPWA